MSSNDAPRYSAWDVASSRCQVRWVASSALGALVAGPLVERVQLVADAVPAVNSWLCGSRPRSSANSRNTTRIITVTAAW